MKKITIKFITDKGINAYKKISSQKQTWKEKQILKTIFREIQISETIIEIKIKIPRLAVQVKLDKKIEEGMSIERCKRDIDYIMVVE